MPCPYLNISNRYRCSYSVFLSFFLLSLNRSQTRRRNNSHPWLRGTLLRTPWKKDSLISSSVPDVHESTGLYSPHIDSFDHQIGCVRLQIQKHRSNNHTGLMTHLDQEASLISRNSQIVPDGCLGHRYSVSMFEITPWYARAGAIDAPEDPFHSLKYWKIDVFTYYSVRIRA